MPSTTPKQARLMAAVAHGWHKPGGGGPPVSVAKDFNKADKGTPMLSKGMKPANASYAAGGPVLGRVREFLKEPDEFREADEDGDKDQDYGKGKGTSTPPNTPKVLKKS
jgi:hypothetical protein